MRTTQCPEPAIAANPPLLRCSGVLRLSPDRSDARFIRRVLILIVIGLAFYALYQAFNILILAFGSVLGAIAIRSLARFFERRGLPHRASVIAGMLGALAAIAFLVWLFTVQFGQQIAQFVTQLPTIIAEIEELMSGSPVGAKIFDAVEQAYAGSRVANDISGLVAGTGTLLLNVLLVVVGSFFLAADPTSYERGLLYLVPKDKREVFAEALDDTGSNLRLWLQAQIILMTTMGVLVGVGLWLAGVPSAAALGLLAGLSEFIPYIGPTVAMIPALGLAATEGPGTLAGAFATYAVVRIIQTNFITPYVQKRVVSIPPAITLFAIIAIGAITGLYGLFFSAALMVVGFTLLRRLYLPEVLGEDVVGKFEPEEKGKRDGSDPERKDDQ